MKPYFIYKEKNSRDMGISILKLPPRIKPERRGEIINVPGRDGFLFESDDAYNNKTLEIECTFIPPEGNTQNQIDAMIMDILVWLDGNGKLIFSDYPGYYYEATIINSIPIERLFKRYRRFIVSFEVQPFSKSLIPSQIEKQTLEEEIFNVKTYYETSLKINLQATGNIEIHINDNIMHFNDIESPLVIDGELMNVTDELGVNMNNHMVGDFPKLKPGNNTISIICDDDSSFEGLILEYRSLWL
jgi:phage-related protein